MTEINDIINNLYTLYGNKALANKLILVECWRSKDPPIIRDGQTYIFQIYKLNVSDCGCRELGCREPDKEEGYFVQLNMCDFPEKKNEESFIRCKVKRFMHNESQFRIMGFYEET